MTNIHPSPNLHERATEITRQATDAEYFLADGNWMGALRAFGRMAEQIPDLASDLIQLAYDEGATKKEIGLALGVSPRIFTGLTRTERSTS